MRRNIPIEVEPTSENEPPPPRTFEPGELMPRQMAPEAPPPPVVRQPRRGLPLALFLATCLTTYLMNGPLYAAAVMFILTAHELGHFLQARRYRMAASWPYFIPVPLPPIGTMGAIIVLPARISNVKALFDMAITGPLAGLVPALAFSISGLMLSEVRVTSDLDISLRLGEPLLFKGLTYLIFGPLEPGQDIFLHPLAFAGWVGILITAVNLVPISQLDGGHILYALLRRKSYSVVTAILGFAIVAIVVGQYWGWTLMILLILIAGPRHPPTADDDVPLGTARHVLGWATLLFVVIGFTPAPLTFTFPEAGP